MSASLGSLRPMPAIALAVVLTGTPPPYALVQQNHVIDPPDQRPQILTIDGSYRRGGITDQLVDAVLDAAEAGGARTERIHLIDERIAFCRNCRVCAAAPLESAAVRGACQLNDAMAPLLARIDAADGLILAAPTNFGSVTAVTKLDDPLHRCGGAARLGAGLRLAEDVAVR